MDTTPTIHLDGKKYLWDGCRYDCDTDASRAAASYQADNFEVHVAADGGTFLVYTRREVQHAAGAPAP